MKITRRWYDKLVPKNPIQNLAFRELVIKRGMEDVKFAALVNEMCAEDPLYYVNTFGYTLNPRKTGCPLIPFVTYPFQDEAMLEVYRSIMEGYDLGIEKSRDMGVTWMVLSVYEHLWHFWPMQQFLAMSRKEDLVDKKGNADCLFAKIDLIHKNLPSWMLPRMERNVLHFQNLDNDSAIDGESTNSNAGRGGRRTSMFLDEFAAVDNGFDVLAATADVTCSRIFVGTHLGMGTAFYKKINTEGVKKLTLHWSLHPEKAKGIYFGEDGKKRSPWYDSECKRRGSPAEIAQELDIDVMGSGDPFFDAPVLDMLERETALAPFYSGNLDFDTKTVRDPVFHPSPKGMLNLWIHPDTRGKVPADRDYVVGSDIAAGTGASNSVTTVADVLTGEKVAEFVTPNLKPHEFAMWTVALCRWFTGKSNEPARLAWEANGPGREFGSKVIELGHTNIYLRTAETTLSKSVSDVPGWWSDRDSKRSLLTDYRSALATRDFINHSGTALSECRKYSWGKDGGIECSTALQCLDPSGARDNHADRVIADALACKLLMSQKKDIAAKVEPAIMPGSMAWRRQDRQRKEQPEEVFA